MDVSSLEGIEIDSSEKRIIPESQTRLTALLTQASPLLFGYPLRRVTSWFIFLQLFALLNHALMGYQMVQLHRLVALVLALLCTKVTMWIVLPILFIVLKWYPPPPLHLSIKDYLRYFFAGQ